MTAVSCLNLQKYSFQMDISINKTLTNSSWLIRNYNKTGKTLCLAECNLIQNCYSVVYSQDSSSNNNCILFSKYFATSELVSLKNSHFYFKECKNLFYIVYFLD